MINVSPWIASHLKGSAFIYHLVQVMEASQKSTALQESPRQQPPVSEMLLPGFDAHDSSSAPNSWWVIY